MLGKERFIQVTPSVYEHERLGLEMLRRCLPDKDPYAAWTSALLLQGSRAYEVDAIVIGYHRVYLVELKAWEGQIEGDLLDWWITDGGHRRYVEGPFDLADRKAKVLATLLRKHLKDDTPWVQPLVFLHGQGVTVRMSDSNRRSVVVGEEELRQALMFGRFPGAPDGARTIDAPMATKIRHAIRKLDLKESERSRRLGDYEVGDLLEEGVGYQDYLSQKALANGSKRPYRLRLFLLPSGSDASRRSRLRQLATREEILLNQVGEHPHILRGHPGLETARGWAVPLEHVDGSVPLDVWLRDHPDATLAERDTIFGQLCTAVAYCHDRKIVHRRIEPRNVLVAPGARGPTVKLKNFQTARQGPGGTETSQRGSSTASVELEGLVYRAPELFSSPPRADERSDVFSLGAVAHLIFTGHPPASSVRELHDRLEFDQCLRPARLVDGVSQGVADAIALATAQKPDDRWETANELLDIVQRALHEEEGKDGADRGLVRLAEGQELEGGLVVRRRLGEGATAVVYLVEHEGAPRVLKIAADDEAAPLLQAEARTLRSLDQARIVKVISERTVQGQYALLLDRAADRTLGRYLREHGSCGLEFSERWGLGLLEVLMYLEEHSVLHRDLKPANLGLGLEGRKTELELCVFDFSHSHLAPENITAGTDPYRDPFVARRGAWDAAADRWSAAIVLYEMVTGTRPVPVTDGNGKVRIEPDALFDACRDELTGFFTKAFKPKATERFISAEEMRADWRKAFARTRQPPKVEVVPLDAVDESTNVFALELSASAKDGLERNGITTAGALARLRMATLRGVGHAVMREIRTLAATLRERLDVAAGPPEVPFFVGYPDDPADVLDVAQDPLSGLPEQPGEQLAFVPQIDEDTALQLAELGYRTLKDVADAPAEGDLEEHVGAKAIATLRRVLEFRAEAFGQGPLSAAGLLERVEEALKQARLQRANQALVRELLGIDGESLDAPTQNALAQARGANQPTLSRLMRRVRAALAEVPTLRRLAELAQDVVDRLGGARRIGQGARALLLELDPDTDVERLAAQRDGRVLMRVAAEVAIEHDLRLRRRHVPADGEIVETVEGLWRPVRELGRLADDLARQEPLPTVQACRAAFTEAIERVGLRDALAGAPLDHPLRDHPETFWIEVGGAVSTGAAVSARGEIYPRDLKPERLIRLIAPSFIGAVTVEKVTALAKLRFPDAPPLPVDKPTLDRLLDEGGYAWAAEAGHYLRKGSAASAALITVGTTTPEHELRGRVVVRDERGLDRRLLRERLETDARRGELRVLMVRAALADRLLPVLTSLLERGTGQPVEVISVDTQLLAALEGRAAALAPDAWDRLVRADARGPAGGADWSALCRFASDVAQTWLDDLLRARRRQPLLMHDLALVVRFRLERFLARLLQAAGPAGELGPVFLVCPQSARSPDPLLLDELPVPALPGQALRIHHDWLDRAGEERA